MLTPEKNPPFQRTEAATTALRQRFRTFLLKTGISLREESVRVPDPANAGRARPENIGIEKRPEIGGRTWEFRLFRPRPNRRISVGLRASHSLILLFLCHALALGNPVEAPPVRLGAIASLTGPAAEQGRNWLRGAELAVRQLEREEGIVVELKVEDDGTRPAAVGAAIGKLLSVNRVHGLIGGTWDFLAEAAAPLAARYGIPFITPTNPVEVFSETTRKTPLFFTNGLSIRATEESMAAVLKALLPKTVAIVVPNIPFGSLHADAVQRLGLATGFSVISRTDFDYAGYHDSLRTSATKIAARKPNLVFCLTDHTGLEVFVRELRRRQFEGWVLTTQHLDEAARLSKTPNLWQKVIGFYPEVRDEPFAQSYREVYGENPKVYSAEGHDALVFLARAIHRGVNLMEASFETQGVTGLLKSIPGNIDVSNLKAVPMVVGQDGQLTQFQ